MGVSNSFFFSFYDREREKRTNDRDNAKVLTLKIQYFSFLSCLLMFYAKWNLKKKNKRKKNSNQLSLQSRQTSLETCLSLLGSE